jgi:monofunctional biosynthetic peptidoglycan transglycosylase
MSHDSTPSTSEDAAKVSRRRRVRRGLLVGGGAVLVALLTGAVVIGVSWPDVAALRTANPRTTAFIERYREQRREAGQSEAVAWTWVPWESISPNLKRAVVSAEDMEFFNHHGFSTSEMRAALREAWEEHDAPRGASTITQQLAKNLWLSPSRNPLRKVREAVLTWQLEHHLSKRRILELYLNVVEFGPGIYGAAAAAEHYFGKPPGQLTEREAAELAASLPRPSRWHPVVGSPAYERYVEEIQRRMAVAEFLWRYVGGKSEVAPLEEPPAALVESIPVPAPADLDTVPNH